MFKEYFAYVKDNPQNLWFKRKLYGWGWTPVKWQGWLVVAIFVLYVVKIALVLEEGISTISDVLWFVVKIIAASGVLIFICYKKGEKPRWQWGIKKNQQV